jgi:hypothetical protein
MVAAKLPEITAPTPPRATPDRITFTTIYFFMIYKFRQLTSLSRRNPAGAGRLEIGQSNAKMPFI